MREGKNKQRESTSVMQRINEVMFVHRERSKGEERISNLSSGEEEKEVG